MRITDTGHGKFTATNGVDTLTAAFNRGCKDSAGKFHPHWRLTLNRETKIVHTDKAGAVQAATSLLCAPLSKPLSAEAALGILARDGMIHGVVAVLIHDLINHDLDGFLDILNEKLTDVLLSDMQYHVVAISEDGIILNIRVSGRVDDF